MELSHILETCLHYIKYGTIGIIAMGAIIAFHEFGHFLFCKLFDIYTPSFSIGFGPKLISKKIGTTEFTLRAIPLGGFVEIAGSAEVGQGEQNEAKRTDEHAFSSKPYYQRLLVMIGGILVNLMFAYFVFIALCWTGMPKTLLLYPKNALPILEKINENSPAQIAGLEIGDKVLAYNGIEINNNVEPFITHIKEHPLDTLNLSIERHNTTQDITINLAPTGTSPGGFGALFEIAALPPIPFIAAIKKGINLTHYYIYQTALGFGSLFKKRDVSQMAGPIRIISLTIQGAAAGFKVLLIFLAVISINLALLNMLPLPILDGGQILFNTIEAIIRRPIHEQAKEYIFIGSWIMILLLMLYLSAQDVTQLFLKPLAKLFGK